MNKNLKIGRKILFSILFVICLFLLKNGSKVNAASTPTYRWPISGENANETYIDYEYYGQAGSAPYKDGKSGREYTVNNNLWPNELYYYNQCESHYGMDITGINGHTYKVASVVEGTVIATSAQYGGNPSTNYVDRNQRRTRAGLNDGGGYGNYIIIEEPSTGRCFLYAHLKGGSFQVSTGDTVHVGQEIATMGSSGDSGHMHLHFEIRVSRQATLNMSWGAGYHRFQIKNANSNLDPKDYIGATPKHITEISLKNPNKTQYIQGTENLDLTGASLTVKYNSGLTSTIDLPNENVKVSGYDKNKLGKQTISVEYEGELLSFDIEVMHTAAKREKITFMRYNDYRKINIYFTSPITVETAPTLTVRVGNETKTATYAGMDDSHMKIMYKIYYSEFDIFTSGKMYIDCAGTVKDEANQTSVVNCNFKNAKIGELKPFKIKDTYEIQLNSRNGDVNLDGYIDARDASIVLTLYSKISANKELTKEEQDRMTRADVNADGYVDSRDASLLLSFYAGVSTGYSKSKGEKAIKCDFDRDYDVDVDDYNLLKSAVDNGNYNSKYDLDGNNALDNRDVEYFRNVMIEVGNRF